MVFAHVMPKVVPDVPAGGNILNALNSIAAVRKNALENEYYKPIHEAEALSKMAYANLMGPQFIAKLMGHPDIVANSPDLQNPNTTRSLYQAGMGARPGQPFATENAQSAPVNAFNRPRQSPIDWMMNKLQNIFGGDETPQSQQQMQPSNNAFAQQPISYGEQPQQIGGQPPAQYSPPPTTSFSENAANYKGIQKEGEESGTIRAKNIDELNDAVLTGENTQATYDNLIKDLSSPVFERMRQVPLAGRHELGWYSKLGTKEEQQMVGDFLTNSGQVVVDTAGKFKGAFRTGEQGLINTMKVNAADTVDTAKGKLESLAFMNKFLTERSRLTSENMRKYHINKLQALEMADKQINGDGIRDQIHDRLNPSVTIENKKTGERITVPVKEAKEKYKYKPISFG